MGKNSTQVLGIDIARFLAACSVMLFHLGLRSWTRPFADTVLAFGHAASFPELTTSAFPGWVGVEIFFVISGFVISYSAHESSAGSFLKSRVLRLVPAAWICGTVTALVLLTSHEMGALPVLSRALRTFAFYPFPTWLDGVYWTLGIEIAFYSTILALLYFDRLRHIEVFALALAFIGLSYVSVKYVHHHGFGWGTPRILQLMLLQHASFFALGTLTWITKRRGLNWLRLSAILICVVTCVLEILNEHRGVEITLSRIAPSYIPVAIFLIALVAIFASVRWSEEISNAASERTKAILRAVGLATYPLYLLHDVVGANIMRVLVTIGIPRYISLASAMLLSIALSVFVAVRLEPIVRRYLRIVWEKEKPRTVSSAGPSL